MSQLGEFENVIVISDEESRSDGGQDKTAEVLSNRRMLQFNWSSKKKRRDERLQSICLQEELLHLSTPHVAEVSPKSDVRRQASTKLKEEKAKRLTIPLVRCDHLLTVQPFSNIWKPKHIPTKNVLNPQEKNVTSNKYLPPAHEKANCSSHVTYSISRKTKRAETFKTDFAKSPRTGKDNPLNINTLVLKSDKTDNIKKLVKRAKAQEYRKSRTCIDLPAFGNKSKIHSFLAFPRRRITEERQAVSSPINCEAPIINFHQPSPTRRHIPNTRISCHRQAFSSPLKPEETIQSELSMCLYSELLRLQYDKGTVLRRKPKDVVQIFRRTVKRKTKTFDFGKLNSPVYLNQMLNLERNQIFGPYWHVYVPSSDFTCVKMPFTEYHDAFVETALEQEEDALEEALAFVKDFKSNRRPTHQTIALIMDAWRSMRPHPEKQNADSVCTLVEILQSCPEVASACVEKLLALLSSTKADEPFCTILTAAFELDLFTRTLCDPHALRRSLSYSLLSVDKNYDTVKAIVEVIKANITTSKKISHTPLTNNEPIGEGCDTNYCKKIAGKDILIYSNYDTQFLDKNVPEGGKPVLPNNIIESVNGIRTAESNAHDPLKAKEQATGSFTIKFNVRTVSKNSDELNTGVGNNDFIKEATCSTSLKAPVGSSTKLNRDDEKKVIEKNVPIAAMDILNMSPVLAKPVMYYGDLDVEKAVFMHSQIKRVFQSQHLLAMAMESSLWNMEMVVCKMVGLMCPIYLSLTQLYERRLLLGSLASPLLTSALAQNVLVKKQYLEVVHRCDQSEFLKSFTATQQEEFAFLFYYTVWGAIETCKHRIPESRRDRLLNLGLATPRMPQHIQQCACHLMALTAEHSACLGGTTHYYLNLTNCLLQAVPDCA